MNRPDLEDLRSELAFHADQAGNGPDVARLVAVRGRIQTRRRRRAGAAIAAVAAVVVAIGITTSLAAPRAAHAPTPATTPHAERSTFAPGEGGDTLIGSQIAPSGRTWASATISPATTNLSVSGYCRLPAGTPASVDVQVDVMVNGKRVESSGCSTESSPGDTSLQLESTSAANAGAWQAVGVAADHPSTVYATLTGDVAAVRDRPGLQVGVAVYELDGPRLEVDGLQIRRLVDLNGHQYRLAGYREAAVTAKSRKLQLGVPAGSSPALLVGAARGGETGMTDVLIDGRAEVSENGSGTMSGIELPDARAHTVGIRVGGTWPGYALIGWYTRIS